MPVGAVWLHACWASAAIAFVARNARRLQKTKSPLRQRAFVELRQIKKFWSGRRDSNPRPRPWQGRALPLSYTRIREFGGDHSPTTGRAMPNAASECNRPTTAEFAPRPAFTGALRARIGPKPAGPGSADCKLALQGPIKARAVLEPPESARNLPGHQTRIP